MVDQFDEFIVKDENGHPVKWDFSKLDSKKQTQTEAKEWEPRKGGPELPTEEEWTLDPVKAQKKMIAYSSWEIKEDLKQEREEERQKQETADREARLDKTWNDSITEAAKEFPDADDDESELYAKIKEMTESDKTILSIPNAPLIIAKLAAAELGILPVSKQKTEPKKETTKDMTGKKTLTNLGGKRSFNPSSSGDKIPPEIQAFRDKMNRFAIKAS